MPTFPVRSPAKMNSPSGCGDVAGPTSIYQLKFPAPKLFFKGEESESEKSITSYPPQSVFVLFDASDPHLNHSGRLWTCASCPEKSGVNRGFL